LPSGSFLAQHVGHVGTGGGRLLLADRDSASQWRDSFGDGSDYARACAPPGLRHHDEIADGTQIATRCLVQHKAAVS
jgi:hypothetical protein